MYLFIVLFFSACEEEIDYCADSPCDNGATCSSVTYQAKYICACADGWSGWKVGFLINGLYNLLLFIIFCFEHHNV